MTQQLVTAFTGGVFLAIVFLLIVAPNTFAGY